MPASDYYEKKKRTPVAQPIGEILFNRYEKKSPFLPKPEVIWGKHNDDITTVNPNVVDISIEEAVEQIKNLRDKYDG
jgi:hypothetical protein